MHMKIQNKTLMSGEQTYCSSLQAFKPLFEDGAEHYDMVGFFV